MYAWPPHVLYDSYGPPYLILNRYHVVTLYLIWNRYCVVPPCTYGPPHVKCLHILYDSYGPPYLIWIRYRMVPPHVRSDGPPLPYMEQVSYDAPHMYDMIFSGQLRKRYTVCPNNVL